MRQLSPERVATGSVQDLSSGTRREIVLMREDSSPLQPLPLQEPVEEHAVEVVRERRHAQVVVDQSGDKIRLKNVCRLKQAMIISAS